ncbi:MAG TPA: Rrf2 family transcriptional regulator [Gemmatimonadaceae bacterium]|nr:Rrf2 family transcriptional regulator [Gemmatimonadaceae bacterium]
MLSTTSDHALRAVLVLARHYGQRLVRADEIAHAIGAPRNYLAKTLNALAKAGVVTSARGPLGGFALASAPDELTLARVVDCFDEPRPSTHCLLGDAPCDPAHPCAAHHCWTAINEARRAPLARTTVAQLLDGQAPAKYGAPTLSLSVGDVATAAA